ncbi:MAG: zinc-dependent alcohol dehydrogenase, partial [Candidatus Geothermincolia bacterium]
MLRAMLHGPGNLVLDQAPEPVPGTGDVLVEVSACGICGSDLHSFRGEHPLVIYPVTPGHEFSGVVVAAGAGVEPDVVGSRVCVEPSLYCGGCPRCRSGRYNICDNLKVMGFQAPGAMCGLVAVPAHRLHPLPDGVDLLSGALAEPAAVGVHAVARSGVKGGERVLVVGAGA